MLIIGCDFHPGFQQVAIFDKQTGELSGKTAAPPRRSGAILPFFGGANRSCGDGSLRALSLVRAAAGGVGSGVVAGGCGENPS